MDTVAELELLEDKTLSHNEVYSTAADEAEQYFYERGKPMPSINHSIVQMLIGAVLLRDERYTVASELALDLNGWKSTPDIVVYPYRTIDWLHDEVRSTEPPLLTIEIVSPSQNVIDLVEKAEKYLANGVQSAWVVQPSLRLISVLTNGAQPTTYTSGTLTDTKLGLTLQMEEIFR